MNTVTLTPLKKKKYVWTGVLKDLIGSSFRNYKSAFMGTCGVETEEKLFLVTYDCVSLADTPGRTWDFDRCNVQVVRFVDVNITIIGESKDE